MILGIVALLASLAWGVIMAGLSSDEIFGAFPSGLFITLFSVMLLIKVCEENGTFEKLTSVGLKCFRKRQKTLPFIIFFFSALLSALGLGNIATTALLAPPALSLSRNLKLNPFLMILMVVGGANASVMSPFSPTGLLARELISKFVEKISDSNPLSSNLFLLSFLFICIIHISGFLLLGGGAWLRNHKHNDQKTYDTDKLDPWDRKQVFTIGILGLFFALNLIFGIGELRLHLPNSIQAIGSEIGFIALFCLVMAALLKIGSLEKAARHLPWGLLIMICGVSTLVSIIQKTVGFGALAELAALTGSGWALVFCVSVFSAFLSVFSSSSGVVMPLFLPMVPALVAAGFGLNSMLLVTIIVTSSHLVDCSPFSSLGALALASVKSEASGSQKLFNNLLIWGLSMVLVGALTSTLAYFLFKLF